MFYKTVSIKEENCNGCGDCIIPCQEGIIEIVGNRAKITEGKSCERLGNCIPNCDAIIIEEKETDCGNIPANTSFERERRKAVL